MSSVFNIYFQHICLTFQNMLRQSR